MLLTELDQRDEVRDLFEGLATNDFTELLETPVTYTLNLALAAEACSYLRDAERARVLYTALLPYAGRNIQVGFGWGTIGAASHYLAMLAVTMELWDDAEKHFESALDMNEKMGARPWLARTAYEYASMLKSSDRDDGRAGQLLTQAAALAADVGMPVLAQRVDALRA
jgi:hypothetical protein